MQGMLALQRTSDCMQTQRVQTCNAANKNTMRAPRQSGRGARGGGCLTARLSCAAAASPPGTPPAGVHDSVFQEGFRV